jgi:hypothetical protein
MATPSDTHGSRLSQTSVAATQPLTLAHITRERGRGEVCPSHASRSPVARSAPVHHERSPYRGPLRRSDRPSLRLMSEAMRTIRGAGGGHDALDHAGSGAAGRDLAHHRAPHSEAPCAETASGHDPQVHDRPAGRGQDRGHGRSVPLRRPTRWLSVWTEDAHPGAEPDPAPAAAASGPAGPANATGEPVGGG